MKVALKIALGVAAGFLTQTLLADNMPAPKAAATGPNTQKDWTKNGKKTTEKNNLGRTKFDVFKGSNKAGVVGNAGKGAHKPFVGNKLSNKVNKVNLRSSKFSNAAGDGGDKGGDKGGGDKGPKGLTQN